MRRFHENGYWKSTWMLLGANAMMAMICCLTGAQELGDADEAIIAQVVRIPETELFPGSRSLKPLEDTVDLLSVLERKWQHAKEEDRAKILSLMIELAEAKVVSRKRYYRLKDLSLAKTLLIALDDANADVRGIATEKLETKFDEVIIREIGPQIIELVLKNANTDAILLLGRTGIAAALDVLATDPRFERASKWKTELARARLGDVALQRKYVDIFKTDRDKDKIQSAKRLAYIGSDFTCKALAEDLRNPAIVKAGAVYSIRVFIIEALSMAFPQEELLWQPAIVPEDDGYYARIEEWAEKKLNVQWGRLRPAFFYSEPRPANHDRPVKQKKTP